MSEVDITEIIVHEGDEPNAAVDVFDSEGRASTHLRDVDLLAVHADASAGEDISVVEGIVEFGQSRVRARGNGIELCGGSSWRVLDEVVRH